MALRLMLGAREAADYDRVMERFCEPRGDDRVRAVVPPAAPLVPR